MESLRMLGYPYTPLDILDTEHRYPGLWEDIFIHLWQNRQIDDLMKDGNG